ncbi:hypothetical protein GGD62_008059 [Bradyrhizobium sp. ERR14]|nr:hypothetical protein [Bradyrhizobium sp. ERR14]
MARSGRPQIFNTDQGSQFSRAAFTGTLATTGVRISMDGRDRWKDNVLIERLWRPLKYEGIYLKGYSDGHHAKAGIARWIAHQNAHLALPLIPLTRKRDSPISPRETVIGNFMPGEKLLAEYFIRRSFGYFSTCVFQLWPSVLQHEVGRPTPVCESARLYEQSTSPPSQPRSL